MMRVVGALTGAFALVGAAWKGSEWAVDHVHKVNDALPTTVFLEYVKNDSIHHAHEDSLIFIQGVENRALLCFIAKYPPAMVATRACPDLGVLARQAGSPRRSQ
jgi:hypothetical protein